MSTYFLDTSIIIDYLRGQPQTVDLVDKLPGKLASSLICLSELHEGAHHSRQPQKAKTVIDNFFHGLSRVYTINVDTADRFGKIRAKLRKTGRMIEDLDLLIAASCLVNQTTLVTRNIKHFSRIPELKLFRLK